METINTLTNKKSNFMKAYLLVFAAFISAVSFSQNFNYQTATGTLGTTYSWIDCSAGSNITSGNDAAANIAWPFNFRFYNSNYTTSNNLSVCTNGFIRLDGAANFDGPRASAYLLESDSIGLGQIIALGVYDDKVGDGGGWVRSNSSGTSPNRIFTIEYNNIEIDRNDTKYADIQVSFFETSNKVVVKFKTDDVTATGADIGIHSGVSGYFNKWQEVQSGTNNTWIEYSIPIVEVNATGGTLLQIYNTIKEAFDAINAGTHTGTLTLKLNGSTTETASAVLNASGSGSANYTSLVLYPTVSNITVSGAIAGNLIQLNGADNVTIDGRVNQSGAANLTISNTSTAASARTIELINSAESNYIQFCNVKGAGTSSTQGTINISNATAGNGNDANYIQYNNISSVSSSNRPINLIYSAGATGYVNDQNTIRNNNFIDFLSTGTASNGIHISTFSNAYSLTGNSFYQTVSFIPTASVEYSAIRVNNSLATDFTISGNYIGGSAATAVGTWTKTNAFNNTFNAIYLNLGNSGNSVQDNTIKGFSYANSGAANWFGINLAGGNASIGTANGNNIGETTGTASITFTAGATNASFYAIYVASNQNITVSNNNIGSITAANATAANATNFYGIHKTASAGAITISNNLIGSTSTANSIQATSVATSNSQILYGIFNLGTGNITISENTIANLNNKTTETTLASRTRGIFSNNGANIIESNTVFKLETTGLSNGTNYASASIVGISVISNTSGNAQTITKNTVYSIETTATGKIELYGIFYDGPDDVEAVVSKNFVHTFVVPGYLTGSTGSYLHGISMFDGSYTVSNNIVYLGNNINTGCSIWGIWTGTNDNAKLYHNTIYLTGVAQTGTSNSFAFRSLYCPATIDLRNNILWDARTNLSGSISHYAVYLNCTTNVTMNYNDYQFAQEFGRVGATAYTTLASWRTGTGFDGNSLDINPQIVNLGGTLPVDYQTNVQLTGTTLAAIPTDFEDVERVAPTMGAWEFFDNPVEIWYGTVYQNAYPTLKGAFDVINAGTYQGDMIIKFRGNTTETASAVLNASGTGPSSYSRILIYPTRSGITVSGNLPSPLVDLNGADNVTFDGRVNGSGAEYSFNFINNNTSTTSGTSTFRFREAATSDTIRYCNIKGGATGTSTAVILLGSSTVFSGNNNNVITLNKITSLSDASRPVNIVLSNGSVGYTNSANKIVSNEIYNFFRKESNSNAVNIQQYSTATTISGNSFYETTSFAPTTSSTYKVITIEDTNSTNVNNVISNNYIGGNAVLAAGIWTKTNANNNEFQAINISAGTSTASNIDNNVIRNFSYANSGNASWVAINVAAGAVNVGKTVGNTIGSATGTGSLSITNATSGGFVYGVNIASTGIVNVENNTIASIVGANSNAANATNLTAINKTATAGATTISKNIIGSTATSNSINASSGSTGNAQTVYGINSAGTGVITMNENTIANLTNGTTNTTIATRGRINGISISDGTSNAVTNNLVRNLTIANANTSSAFEMPVVGINLIESIANRTVTNNVVYNLSNTYATFAGFISGIYYRGATTGTNSVTRNFVHSLSTTNAGGSLLGIVASMGATTYANNIITLGNATNNVIYGFYDINGTSQVCNVYYNTVYIGGTTSGNNSSYAMFSGATTGTRNYRNNIFINTRTRTSGTGSHVSMNYSSTGTSGLTVNYNDYIASGTGGVLCKYGGTNYTTLATMQSGIGQDANSLNQDPTFVSAGSTSAADYKVGVTLTAVTGTGVANDYGVFSRPASSPTMGAWERNVNKWKGTNTTDWGTASNWTGNLVPDEDATIEFDPVPLRHCIMDINRSVMNIINAQNVYRVVTNGKTLTIKGELQFTNGAQIDASATSSKVVFAGAAAQVIPTESFYNNEVFNLEVNNSNNVTIYGAIRLLNTISSVSGRFDTYSNFTDFIYGGTAAQTIENNVFLDNKGYNMVIDNTAGTSLNTDFTLNNNLTVNSGKFIQINTTRTMTVLGTITNQAGTAGIVIKSSPTEANGSLIFLNSLGSPVNATVEMYSRSTWDLTKPAGGRYNWQFFGIPLRTLNALPTFYGGYVREKLESGTTTANHWQYLTNSSTLNPFYGYELCFQTQRTISFNGELVNSNFSSGQLPKTTGAIYPGQILFANPYTAAIDIRQIEFGSDMEATVYLYNTGSFNAWAGSATKIGDIPGSYISIPKNLAGFAGIPRQVPSMSSMLTKVITSTTNAYVNLNYSSVVMGNTDRQRAPGMRKSKVSEDEIVSTVVTVDGATSGDKVWLFASDTFTRTFDNGYDGIKVYPATGKARLFASESDNDYQINAVDDLNNTNLKFRAATGDTNYTLTFEHENTENKYESLFLYDMVADTLVDITESSSTYTFNATNTTSSVLRFRIIANPLGSGVSTSNVNVYAADNNLFIKRLADVNAQVKVTDLTGRLIAIVKVDSNGLVTLPIEKQKIYIVTITSQTGTYSQKVMIK